GCVIPRHCAALVKLRSSTTVTSVRNSSVGIFVIGHAAAWRRSGPRHRADGFSPTRSGPFPIREKFRNFLRRIAGIGANPALAAKGAKNARGGRDEPAL